MNLNPPRSPISVVAPVSPAIERARDLLFRPFDLSRWLVIGFSAWLAMLGEAPAPSFNGRQGNQNGPGGLSEAWREFTRQISDNIGWLIWVVPVVLVLALAIGLLVTWLSSRGRFMFLHNVATGRAEIGAPWTAYAEHANHLFLFRVILGLGSFAVMAPFAAAGAWATIIMVRQEQLIPFPLLIAVSGFGITFALGLAFMVIEKLTADFVVPVMYLRTASVRAAWAEFYGLLRQNLGGFTLYLLFYLVLDLAVAVVMLVCLVICCVACCILAIPYLGTVLVLPFLIFLRSYSALFLAQFGPQYDCFQAPTQSC